jgi:DNA-directed RNA polymerase subunit L
MKVEFLKDEKDDVEITIDNPTIAELMRVYLNKSGVKFAAWRREHPSKPVIMKIQTSGESVKKAVSEAVSLAQKDIDEIISFVKKK